MNYRWDFKTNGMLNFPKGGDFNVSGIVPDTSSGAIGDKAGTIAADSLYFYYCVEDYTDGNSAIWKRVGWQESW